MGGCCAREKFSSLEKSERLQLIDLYQQQLCTKDPEDKENFLFDPEQLIEIFSLPYQQGDDYKIGLLLYDYLVLLCDPKPIDMDTFLKFAEALIKDAKDISAPEFTDLSQIEIIALIYISSFDKDSQELKFQSDLQSSVNFNDALNFMKLIQYMSFEEIPGDFYTTQIMVQTMFTELGDDQNSIVWKDFIQETSRSFRYLDQSLKKYFRHRLLTTDKPFEMPKFFSQNDQLGQTLPTLIDDNIITILGMTDQLMTMDRWFTMIYQASQSYFNFESMVKTLENFGGATFIIAEFTDTQNQKVRLGSFVPVKWQIDGAKHFCEDTMIFLLYPYCKVFRSEPRQKDLYSYLFSPRRGLKSLVDSQKIAMAFGDQENMKIWIDQDMVQSSFFKIFINGQNCTQSKNFSLTELEIYGMSRFQTSRLEEDMDVWDQAIRKTQANDLVKYPSANNNTAQKYKNDLTATNNMDPLKTVPSTNRPSNLSQPPQNDNKPRRTADDVSRAYNARHSQKF